MRRGGPKKKGKIREKIVKRKNKARQPQRFNISRSDILHVISGRAGEGSKKFLLFFTILLMNDYARRVVFSPPTQGCKKKTAAFPSPHPRGLRPPLRRRHRRLTKN